ncbi:hypothetical protein [Streptomyces sp. NBRC 110028]|uniref:hypothetical protein n=1 Tax=Streptomyces sp. NBRC 110028 TaxID=1621260 RepID=UPI000B20A1CE
MKRRTARSILAASALLLGGLAATPAAHARPASGTAGEALSVWTAQVTRAQVPLLLRADVDGTASAWSTSTTPPSARSSWGARCVRCAVDRV